MAVQIQPTYEIPAPWLKPPVARIYLTPRARLRRFRNRFLASAFVADLKAGYERSLVILGAVGFVFGFFVVIRGGYIAALMAGIVR